MIYDFQFPGRKIKDDRHFGMSDSGIKCRTGKRYNLNVRTNVRFWAPSIGAVVNGKPESVGGSAANSVDNTHKNVRCF